jgi:hypothetical protein
MAKIAVYVRWMFPDQWTSCTLEFIEAKEGEKKKGTEFYFCGADGDCRTFPGKIKNLKDLIKSVGPDTEQWVGKRFSVTTTDDKKYFILTPI